MVPRDGRAFVPPEVGRVIAYTCRAGRQVAWRDFLYRQQVGGAGVAAC